MIRKTDSKRNYTTDVELVKAEIIPKKISSEMPPAVRQQLVHLRAGDGLSMKFLVDECLFEIEHYRIHG